MPDPADPDSPECLVDQNDTTWVADDWGFQAVNSALDLHPDADYSWRGYPAQSPDSGPAPNDAVWYQGVYREADHALSDSSTADWANPKDDLVAHAASDVLPHLVWGGDYAAYDMSSGEALSQVSQTDPQANIYPCEQGDFVGGSGFGGIDASESADDHHADTLDHSAYPHVDPAPVASDFCATPVAGWDFGGGEQAFDGGCGWDGGYEGNVDGGSGDSGDCGDCGE